MLREPAVAGRFYPADPEILRHDLRSYLSPSSERTPAIACMVPHAGYMYSGAVAGAVFSKVIVPSRCIILCPNHTGRGHPLSLMKQGGWRTPLGDLKIDQPLAEVLLREFPALTDDSDAHRFEHAIEVELPFLRVIKESISMCGFGPAVAMLTAARRLGAERAELVQYTTSADASGDRETVVGYAGIIVT